MTEGWGGDGGTRAELPAGIDLRPATAEDHDAVVAFTSDTWGPDTDYIPDVYHDWIRGGDRQTLVADAGDAIAGIAQCVLLSRTEAWAQGMRVNPDFRGQGVGTAIQHGLFGWAREAGATVVRNMVFSWNAAGLGHSRALGFEPVTEFRWVHPDPATASGTTTGTTKPTSDVDAAWTTWTESAAREHLAGLALDLEESWSLRTLTREMLARAAEETALLSVVDGEDRAMAYRTRTYERETEDGETEQGAEYGVAAWTSETAAASLLSAIAADAADCGVDRTRVLVPETPRAVSDAALSRVDLADAPDFVFAADIN